MIGQKQDNDIPPSLSNSHGYKTKIYFSVLLAASIFMAYANIIDAPFLWDDEIMVVNNPLIRSMGNFFKIFTTSAFGQELTGGSFYRPLQILSYTVEYRLWGLNPVGYHLTSIWIHTLSCFLLWYLLGQMGFSLVFAYGIAQVFAIHPVHIECVTYISGRGDLLYLLFCLLTFIFYLKTRKSKFYAVLSVLSFLMALLSKENAVPLPIILGLYAIFLQKSMHSDKEKPNSNQIALLILLNAAMLAFIAIRVFTAGETGDHSYIANASFWDRVFTYPRSLITYIRLMVLPYNLHMDYHFVTTSPWSLYIWLGLPAIALVLTKCCSVVGRRKTLVFGAWFFVGLLPVSNVFFPLTATLRKHWLYLPSIGFLVLAGLVIQTRVAKNTILSRQSQYVYALPLCLAIACLMTVTVNRNKDWQTPMGLYQHDLALEPRSHSLHNNVGVEYLRAKQYQKAKASFLAAIKNNPTQSDFTAYTNLGLIFEKENKIDEAIDSFHKSIKIGNHNRAYGGLGRIYMGRKEYELAVKVLQKGNNIHPNDTQIMYLLGASYYFLGQRPEARAVFSKLEAIHPDFKDTRKIIRLLGP